MTDAEMLTAVKTVLFGSASNAYSDDLLQLYIADVQAFMVDAGVPANVVTSSAAVGCIARGVNDTWNYSSGNVEYSPAFYKRLVQLSSGNSTGGGANVQTP